MTLIRFSLPLPTRTAASLLVFALLASAVHADCSTDLHGEVYCGAGRCIRDTGDRIFCSRHFEGGVEVTRDGVVLCGVGDCARDRDGAIFCSSEVGGAVLRDSRGRVRCYGRCEPGSVDHCESVRADTGG